jgi:phage terminase large subunit-like protein
VRDGILKDEAFLPVIYEADPDDDWTIPATWYKAHPGLGISVKEDYFAAECTKAQQLPGYENTFKRLLLNIWTEQNTRWIPIETWDKCNEPLPDLTGRTCYAGLDLATTTDIAALVLAFPIGPKVHLLPFFFVPAEGIRRRAERDRVPYIEWAREGHLIATDGAVIDYEIIRSKINELSDKYHIKEIAIDRWNATHLATQLTGDGFEMIGFGQGYASMSAPTKELERRILAQEVNHAGNEVLRWMANNVSIKQDEAGNMKPDKSKSNGRIDGIVAALMALGRIMQNDDERGSVYDKGEIFFV